jgi:uncharacterized protein (DUF1778 family)
MDETYDVEMKSPKPKRNKELMQLYTEEQLKLIDKARNKIGLERAQFIRQAALEKAHALLDK